MGRRRKGEVVNGWVNLDKPAGMTSTQAVGKVRRFFNAQKVGHAGTLDPLATGILPIALGEATKTIPYCQDAIKTYSFSIIWGEARSTDDAEGEIVETSDIRPEEQAIRDILAEYTGDIEQMPPQFSALKVEGKRAYDLAREGKTVDLKARTVYVESLGLLKTASDRAHFHCVCGKGTYMRSLARDIARSLGTVGYIADLRREAVGPFKENNAISLAKIEEIAHSAAAEDLRDKVLLPVEVALDDIPALQINEQEVARLKNGQKILFIARPDLERLHRAGIDLEHSVTALTLFKNKPVALVTVDGAEIQPTRVLNL